MTISTLPLGPGGPPASVIGLGTWVLGGGSVWGADTADWNPWYAPENRRRILDLLAGWGDLTARHRCTPAQLVLAWTLAQPGVTHALVGARTVEQLRENAAAGRIDIPPEDLIRMRGDLLALGDPDGGGG